MLGLTQKSEHSSATFCKSSHNFSGSFMRSPIERYMRREIPCAKHLDLIYRGALVINLRKPYKTNLFNGQNIVLHRNRSCRPLRNSLFLGSSLNLVDFAVQYGLKSGLTSQEERS